MRRAIIIVGLLFLLGIVAAFTNETLISISQINQTNGEKFTEAVMPATYVTNITVNPYNMNRSNVTGQEGVDTAQNQTQTNQANYDNLTFGEMGWINTTNQAQDANLTVTRTFVNTTNRINGGFSPYFKNVAAGDVYELPFIFYNGTLKCVGLRATNGIGNVTMSVGNRSNDITGGNNLILNNAQEAKDCTLTGWNTTVNIDEVFKLTVISVNGSVGNLSVPFVIARD